MSRTLNERLQHVNDGLDSSPLLSQEEIREALRRTPVSPAPEVQLSWWSRNRTTVSVGTAALAVASIIAFIILPDDTFLSPSHPGEFHVMMKDDGAAAEPSVVGNAVPAPALADAEVQNGQGASAHDFAAVDEIQRAAPISSSPNGLSTNLLVLSKDELANLGLSVTTRSIRYDEGAFRISIGTSGIAAQGTMPSQTEHVTPRHVSLYRSGQVWASWFDETDPATTPNDLLPVHIHLESPSSTTFPNADVILWYEPTDEFVKELSVAHQREIGKDLQAKNGDAMYVERSTHLPSVTTSSVFPNPVRDGAATLRLDVTGHLTSSAALVDINGRTVMQLWQNAAIPPGTTDREIGPLFDLANGMYLIVVTDVQSGERLVQRLLIER